MGLRRRPCARSGTGCVMAMMRSEARNGLRYGVLGLAADRCGSHHHQRCGRRAASSASARALLSAHHAARVHHHASAEDYSPPSASIVVDGNTGAVLQASNPDASAPSGLADQDHDALPAVRAARCRQDQARHAAQGLRARRRPGADQARSQARPDHRGRRRHQGRGDPVGQRRRRRHRRKSRRQRRASSPS